MFSQRALENDQSRLTYFRGGAELQVLDFGGTASLNTLSDEHVIIKHNPADSMKCFSLQDDGVTLTWDLSCETGPRHWQVKELGGRYFLLTD